MFKNYTGYVVYSQSRNEIATLKLKGKAPMLFKERKSAEAHAQERNAIADKVVRQLNDIDVEWEISESASIKDWQVIHAKVTIQHSERYSSGYRD